MGMRDAWLLGAALGVLAGAAQTAETEVEELLVSGGLEETLPQTTLRWLRSPALRRP